MYCKPDQIVRIVKASMPDLECNINRLLVTKRLLSSSEREGLNRIGLEAPHDLWVCEALQTIKTIISIFNARHGVSWGYGDVPAGETITTCDRFLRPLYDGDGVDEVLRKVGRPTVNSPHPNILINP